MVKFRKNPWKAWKDEEIITFWLPELTPWLAMSKCVYIYTFVKILGPFSWKIHKIINI